MLDEADWAAAGTIPGLPQQEPEPGRPTPFDATRVSVLSDGETLYFGIACPDPQPQAIAVHTLQRDADREGDDSVALVLDTFGDGRTGYLFRINAGGARQDGLISGREDVSLDWDGLWDARVRRTPEGWTAEIALSARSLRFRPGLPRWGFNVERTWRASASPCAGRARASTPGWRTSSGPERWPASPRCARAWD